MTKNISIHTDKETLDLIKHLDSFIGRQDITLCFLKTTTKIFNLALQKSKDIKHLYMLSNNFISISFLLTDVSITTL